MQRVVKTLGRRDEVEASRTCSTRWRRLRPGRVAQDGRFDGAPAQGTSSNVSALTTISFWSGSISSTISPT